MFPFIPTVYEALLKVAFALTVRFVTYVAAVIVTVFVLVPSPMVTFGLVLDGEKLPILVVPVNKIVPGPTTPWVVVPAFEKVPDTVRVMPELIVKVLLVVLRVRFAQAASAVTDTENAPMVTSSPATGTAPSFHVVVTFQAALAFAVLFAA